MSDKNQIEKFKKAARELGADESEERFNERLKRIARKGGKPIAPARQKPKKDSEK